MSPSCSRERRRSRAAQRCYRPAMTHSWLHALVTLVSGVSGRWSFSWLQGGVVALGPLLQPLHSAWHSRLSLAAL